MTSRLSSVRTKFTMLVVLPVLLVLAVFPFISRVMERQLARQADERIDEARAGFQDELDDATSAILLTARSLSENSDVRRALVARDPNAGQTVVQTYSTLYPDNDILLVESDGTVLTKTGPSPAPDKLTDVTDFAEYRRGELRGIAQHGCAKPGTRTSSARFVALDAGDAGSVVVCQMLGKRYVAKIAAELGLELAILDAARDDALIVASKQFPVDSVKLAHAVPERVESAGKNWVIARFEPRLHVRARGKLGVVLARDVTDIRTVVRRQLVLVMGLLLLAAVLSLAVGTRLALTMSNALGRVGGALKKLEQQEYVKVEGVKTGDELEDLAIGFNQMVDGLKERDKLRTTFGKYMTEAVVEHLMAGKVALGGESLTVTILFSDIRSFTSISEKMDAQSLVGLLNEYFTEMVTIVMQNDGVVDKYIGDAIMAVFGAPVPRPEDAKNAVRAAVQMRASLARLNERLVARGISPLETGIGLHTGEVVAGNIGSERRMEYTVIGDAVNLASRLEGSTKDFGVGVIISDATYQLTKDIIVARPLKEIHVKGRGEAVMTYEVTAIQGEDPNS